MKLTAHSKTQTFTTEISGTFKVRKMTIGDNIELAQVVRELTDEYGNIKTVYSIVAKILLCVRDVDNQPIEVEAIDDEGNAVELKSLKDRVVALSEGGETAQIMDLHSKVNEVNPIYLPTHDGDDEVEEKKSE